LPDKISYFKKLNLLKKMEKKMIPTRRRASDRIVKVNTILRDPSSSPIKLISLLNKLSKTR
jgi:hypothetical protein